MNKHLIVLYTSDVVVRMISPNKWKTFEGGVSIIYYHTNKCPPNQNHGQQSMYWLGSSVFLLGS